MVVVALLIEARNWANSRPISAMSALLVVPVMVAAVGIVDASMP